MKLPDMPAGIYRHYKGHHYLVLGYARDSNDESRVGVVYVGLETEGARNTERMAFRTYWDFHSWVDPQGKRILDCEADLIAGATKRFTYVGPSMDLTS